MKQFSHRLRFALVAIAAAVSAPNSSLGSAGDMPVETAGSSPSLTMALLTPWPGNIAFTAKKPAGVSVVLHNPPGAAVRCRVHLTVDDWYGTERGFPVRSIAIGSNSDFTQEIAIDLSRPDYYSIEVQVSVAGRPAQNLSDSMVVTQRPADFGRDDPTGFFGIQAVPTQSARTERLGATWVRTNADADPAMLARIRHNHQMIMATLWPFHWGGSVTVACLGTLPDMASLDSIIHADAPYVDTFEIMNEPDLNCADEVHLGFQASVDYYLNVLRQVAPAIHRDAPDARVSAIDVSGVDYDNGLKFANDVLAHGGGAGVDVLSCHPYVYPRNFGVGQRPIWPTAGQAALKCRETLAMIKKYGGKQAFWVGEKGWGLDVTADPLGSFSRDFASCLAQSFVTEKSVPGVKRYFWYCEEDDHEGAYEYGLFRRSGPLPAALAYATVARLLHHAQPYRSPERSDTVQTHCFVCPESHTGTLVVWNDSRNAVSLVAKMPGAWKAFDIMGNPLASSGHGALRLRLDRSPVYIRFPENVADRACSAIANATATYSFPLDIENAYVPDLSHVAVCVRNFGARAVVGKFEVGEAHTDVTIAAGRLVTVVLPAPSRLATDGLPDIPVRVSVAGRTRTISVRLGLASCRRVPSVPPGGLMAPWKTPPDFVLDKRSQIMPPDSGLGWNGPADLSASAWTGWDESALYVSVRVHDQHQVVLQHSLADFWNSDSVQIGVDPHDDAAPGAGYDASDVEIGLVLAPNGPRAYETAPQGRRLQIPCAIVRRGQDQTTLYEVAIPWTLLGLQPKAGDVLGFDFIVNQNNGQGRTYWIGLTPGIGDRKQPSEFQRLYLAPSAA